MRRRTWKNSNRRGSEVANSSRTSVHRTPRRVFRASAAWPGFTTLALLFHDVASVSAPLASLDEWLAPVRASLEDAYLELTRDEVEFRGGGESAGALTTRKAA